MMKEILPGLTARLRVCKRLLDGASITVFEENNLIVTSGKAIILNQLYYSSGSGDPLSYAKIGTGGAIDPAGNFLKVPTVDMTDLYTPIASAAILKTEEDVTIPSVTLVASVDNSVGNGSTINEAGFFSASGSMFNIKTFPGVLKDSSFSLDLIWVIKML